MDNNQQLDYFDAISAIWILSCNDENPIMTNAGIVERLGLANEEKVRALVNSRRELFRPGISSRRLGAWKARLRTGAGLPGWLQDITDAALRQRRIEEISRADVFRNQFRVAEGAARCDLATIDWGLQHIERLRKADAEARDARRQKWSSLVIPAGSLGLAALSLFGSTYVQISIANSQISSKQYETTLKPKQEGYTRYMTALFSSYRGAAQRDREGMNKSIMDIENSYYLLEPFLSEVSRAALWDANQEYEDFCRNAFDMDLTSKDTATVEKSVKDFTERRRRLRSLLYGQLFVSGASSR